MGKEIYVLRAIVRAGLDPLEFNIYSQPYVKSVIIEHLPNEKHGTIINTIPDKLDPFTSLTVHPDDGIKRVTIQIKEKFNHMY